MKNHFNKSFSVKGTIGKSSIPVNSLLGNILIAANAQHKQKTSRTYKQRYSRNVKTYTRLLKSVELLRYLPKYSTNDIGDILGVSWRTSQNYIRKLYKLGYLKFNCMRNKLYRRSKNLKGLNKLKQIFRAFIHGDIDLLDVYRLTGWDPP